MERNAKRFVAVVERSEVVMNMEGNYVRDLSQNNEKAMEKSQKLRKSHSGSTQATLSNNTAKVDGNGGLNCKTCHMSL